MKMIMKLVGIEIRRCFSSVDPSSEESSKLVAIDEEPNHEIVHRRRFRKANRATDEPLDPRPQIDVLTLNSLGMLLANVMLRGVEMALVGAPPIGVKADDAKWFKQFFQLEKHRIFMPPKDIRQHGSMVVINRMPEPARFGFLAHVTPHLVEL